MSRRQRTISTTSACAGLALAALVAGCSATSFTPRVEPAQVALQWPFPPNPAKLTYVRSLTGFTAKANAGSSLRRLVAGKESADRNAFVLPVAVAVGADGRIAVADMGRRCVHLYLPEAGKAGAASGKYLQLTGDPKSPIVSPVGLAFDDASRLYLTDSAGRLFAFGAQGELLWSTRAAGETPWQRPTGLAWSPQTQLLYVVDTLAHRVYGLHTDGKLELSFGGRGEGVESFNFPTHIFRADIAPASGRCSSPTRSTSASAPSTSAALRSASSAGTATARATWRCRRGWPPIATACSTSPTASSTTCSCSTARGAFCSPSAAAGPRPASSGSRQGSS